MFIQVREGSKYYVSAIYREPKGQSFTAEIEHADGKHFQINYSSITNRFYKNNEKAKLPKYLCTAVLDLAISGGIIIMNRVERANALFWL